MTCMYTSGMDHQDRTGSAVWARSVSILIIGLQPMPAGSSTSGSVVV